MDGNCRFGLSEALARWLGAASIKLRVSSCLLSERHFEFARMVIWSDREI